MRSSLKVWAISGIIFTFFAGILLHFLYDWTDHSVWAALISPVNESVWEHLKLLFFPAILFILIANHFLHEEYPAFFPAHAAGLLAGLLFIPTVSGLYSTVLGRHILLIDILIFLSAVVLTFLLGARVTQKGTIRQSAAPGAALLLLFIAVLFFLTPLYQ